MHQTFYIDVDEEISSVIDRLNKSMSIDNYFVVPKRALFLQSIVNLKILKREADKISKSVIIVTQDEIGIAMAERSGIEVQSSLDGLNAPSDIYADKEEAEEIYEEDGQEEQETEDASEESSMISNKQDKQIRLSNVGSGEYYQANEERQSRAFFSHTTQENPKLAINSHVAPTPLRDRNVKTEKPRTIVLEKIDNKQEPKRLPSAVSRQRAPLHEAFGVSVKENPYGQKLDPSKEHSLERLFSKPESKGAPVEQKNQSRSIGGGKIKKVFFVFMLLCLLVLVGLAAYLFVPSAKIILTANVTTQKVDADIAAATNISKVDQSNIPLRVIDQDQQLSLTYDVTSQTTVSGQKAHGSVVISNEFSSAPQTLVATTRIQSADGKIFHLVKTVVVPGSASVGGQLKPGSVQADIIADQAGSDYNIDPTKFTIPGFANGPKFDKFYANSAAPLTGGSSDGQQASGGSVSQSDLDSAKQKTEAALTDKFNDLIKSQLASGEVSLPQAEKITVTKSSTIVKVGTNVASFDWVVTGSVHALIFSENDVKSVINQSLQSGQQSADIHQDISKVDYGSVEPDFDANTLQLKVFGEITNTPVIDSAQVKNELLGKDDTQLSDILKKYTSIKNADVEFSPTFITRIPQYSYRVSVEVKTQ